MEAYRPITADLWIQADTNQRARMVRHLRPWWDVHRHRIAPRIGEALDALKAGRRLTIRAGRLGQVDHADLVGLSDCLYNGDYYGAEDTAVSEGGDVGAPDSGDVAEEPASGELCAESYWYATVRRSVFIEGNLYSISDYGVKITEATDPTALQGTVLFWPAAVE
jgi:hypothetical protein